MVIDDTQDVVVGLIGGMGTNNLSSVAVLKYNDKFAQFAYDNDFNSSASTSTNSIGV